MRRRLTLLALAAIAIVAPFATPAPQAQAWRCSEDFEAVCFAAAVACRADDTLYEKSAAYRKLGGIECFQ